MPEPLRNVADVTDVTQIRGKGSGGQCPVCRQPMDVALGAMGYTAHPGCTPEGTQTPVGYDQCMEINNATADPPSHKTITGRRDPEKSSAPPPRSGPIKKNQRRNHPTDRPGSGNLMSGSKSSARFP